MLSNTLFQSLAVANTSIPCTRKLTLKYLSHLCANVAETESDPKCVAVEIGPIIDLPVLKGTQGINLTEETARMITEPLEVSVRAACKVMGNKGITTDAFISGLFLLGLRNEGYFLLDTTDHFTEDVKNSWFILLEKALRENAFVNFVSTRGHRDRRDVTTALNSSLGPQVDAVEHRWIYSVRRTLPVLYLSMSAAYGHALYQYVFLDSPHYMLEVALDFCRERNWVSATISYFLKKAMKESITVASKTHFELPLCWARLPRELPHLENRMATTLFDELMLFKNDITLHIREAMAIFSDLRFSKREIQTYDQNATIFRTVANSFGLEPLSPALIRDAVERMSSEVDLNRDLAHILAFLHDCKLGHHHLPRIPPEHQKTMICRDYENVDMKDLMGRNEVLLGLLRLEPADDADVLNGLRHFCKDSTMFANR